MPKTVQSLKVKIFGDGADKEAIFKLNQDPLIAGFTTNPTLMRRANISDYERFAREVLAVVKDKPISFEVFSDDFDAMEKQARAIASWGDNVNVKVTITNTKGESSLPLIERLSGLGIKLNITAMTTFEQVEEVVPALSSGAGGIVSVLAGRIADTGRDPLPIMLKCVEILKRYPGVELLWASPRELYNIVQADDIGCHIITVTGDILKKLPLLGGDLDDVSLDTVKMFFNDAQAAKFSIAAE
jgi:transaldolase